MSKRRRRLRWSLAVGMAAVAIALVDRPGDGVAAAQAGSASADQNPSGSGPVPPIFRAGANLVLVDAYPRKNGRIVEGLTPADFQVFEDGKPQAISNFEFVRIDSGIVDSARRDPNTVREMNQFAADPHNRVFIAFLDTTHTQLAGGVRIHKPLVDTLDRVIGPEDLFGVMTQDMSPPQIALGRRMTTVDEELGKYGMWGESDRVAPERDSMEFALNQCYSGTQVADGGQMVSLAQVLIDRRREDRTLTSLEDLVKYVTTLREARTVVIAITDGWILYTPNQGLMNEASQGGAVPYVPLKPTGGILPANQAMSSSTCDVEAGRLSVLDDQRRLRDLEAAANRANVSFFPVSSGGLQAFDSTMAQSTTPNPNAPAGQTALSTDLSHLTGRLDGLRNLAENTDGIAIIDTNDLAGGVGKIVDDVSAYYLLGYSSTNAKDDGKFRTIDVKMRQPGMAVHARRGYLAPSASEREAAATAAKAAPTNTVDVAPALEALGRIQESGELYTSASRRGTDLSVVLELASRLVGSDAWAKGGTANVTVTDASGARVGVAEAPFTAGSRSVVVHVPIAAGVGPLGVVGTLSGAHDQIDSRTSAPPPEGALLGDPSVSRATPSPRSVLGAVGDPEFRRTERLHVEWPELQALDARVGRLLDRRGQPLPIEVAVTERAVDGVSWLAADLNLAPLAEGDYVVEVTAGAAGKSERKLIAFRLVR